MAKFPGDLGNLMKHAQAMQEQMAKFHEEAAQKVVEASVGGNMVSVKMSGAQDMLSITIDPELIKSGDHEMLQEMIVAAVNEGLRKSRALISDEMKRLAGIPGMF